ncbi:MAG: T9SS C-terminal target domain-containing protein [Candidatus Zixiibacteriota bacterium]|nr:MAG: T9SS C-terminal target domain-containing protein [candidate division Zixibacteria bacterium]
MPYRTEVELELFNVLGQKVTSLVSGPKTAGQHSVVWDGRFDNGRAAPSGIYFYRLRAGTVSRVGKMVLLK